MPELNAKIEKYIREFERERFYKVRELKEELQYLLDNISLSVDCIIISDTVMKCLADYIGIGLLDFKYGEPAPYVLGDGRRHNCEIDGNDGVDYVIYFKTSVKGKFYRLEGGVGLNIALDEKRKTFEYDENEHKGIEKSNEFDSCNFNKKVDIIPTPVKSYTLNHRESHPCKP